MKFLHEMISKKRAQHVEAKAPESGPADAWQDAAPVPHAPREPLDAPRPGPEAARFEDTGWPRPQAVDPDDNSELFDDGAYDWDLDSIDLKDAPEADTDDEDDHDHEPAMREHGMGDAAAEATETEEDAGDDEHAPAPAWSAAPAAGFHAPSAEAHEDDEDEDAAAEAASSAVLRDVIARSRVETPAAPATPADSTRSSLEENVEKLRLQRKIWDLEAAGAEDEDDDAEDRAASAHRDAEDEVTRPLAVENPGTGPVSADEPVPAAEPAPIAPAPAAAVVAAAASGDPALSPQMRRAGRVKTRLLGFHKGEGATPDPFAAAQQQAPEAPGEPQFPVGWLVVMRGPGRGAAFTLTAGASKIGRGEDQAIRLDFGDTSISRDNHAAVAYDDEQRTFYIGHGGKANLVRLNNMPVLSTEPLNDGDLIRIGETTLQFVAFCGPDFSWEEEDEGKGPYAAAE